MSGGLAVDAYEGVDGGGFNHAGTAKTNIGTPLLRLIVVGINSFNGKNGNNTQHVVFPFLNMPVTRRMNATGTSAGGYPASELREYLVPAEKDSGVAGGNFLAGLLSAGVPESVLWGPARVMSKKDGEGKFLLSTDYTDLLIMPSVTCGQYKGAADYAD